MTIVVKFGGSAESGFAAASLDAATICRSGEPLIVAHGGSCAANALGESLGCRPKFIESTSGVHSRYTDAETLRILTMALVGGVKTTIVSMLAHHGVRAVGLSGVDAGIVHATRKCHIRAVEAGRTRIVRDDLTGKITDVNVQFLSCLLQQGYVPVLSPPALDPIAGPLNVDGDRLAAAIAGAMQAETLIILSNVPGLLRDVSDRTSVVPRISATELPYALSVAKGRMKLKIIAAKEALEAGVKRVFISDATVDRPIQQALAGRGTVLQSSFPTPLRISP